MKRLIALLFISGCNCGRGNELQHSLPCGQLCYTGPTKTENVGACRDGIFQCNEDGGTTCVGEVLPGSPVCGTDSDCDGSPDLLEVSEKCYDGPDKTDGVGICHNGTKICSSTGWSQCKWEQTPLQEVCNGLDNDCDGVIGDIPPDPCYTGPPGTVTDPGCHYGYQMCSGTQIVCKDEATPHQANVAYDVVFIITTDGTMSQYQSVIAQATTQWCDNHLSSSCALVVAQDTNVDFGGGGGWPTPVPLNNLDTQTFNQAIGAVTYQPSNWSGDVPIYDSIFDVCDTAHINPMNTLSFGWHTGNTRVEIFFTDEEGQWIYNTTPEYDIASTCAANNVTIYGFGAAKDFSPIDYSSFSTLYALDASLSQRLNQILSNTVCY